MIKNSELAFLLKIDFNYSKNSKSKLKNIIEKLVSHPPFFLNYIGFFENEDSYQKDNYHKGQEKKIYI